MLQSIAAMMVGLCVPLELPAAVGAHSIPNAVFAARVSASSHKEQDDQLAKQEAELREAVRREPNNAASLARLGYVLAMENKFAESAHLFEQALSLNPSDAEARRSLATDYWQLGQSEKARTNLEIVLKAKPNDEVAKLLLGMVSEEMGDHQRAAKLLGEVLPLVRQRPETIAALARANYSLGELEKARAALQLLVGHPAGPEAAFQGGRLAAEFKDYQTAEKMFISIQTTYPDAGALNYNLALAQFSAKHYESCEKTLLSSIGYGHGTPDAYALLGWTYGKENQSEEMLKAFEKAINMDPSNQAHFIDLGEALVEKKNYGTALAVAKEAVKRFSTSSQAYRLKGSVELKMYLLTEALKSYTTATELDPNNPRAAMGLALTQWNMDRTDDAAKSFEEGVRKFPDDAFFLLKYALFLLNAPGERDAQAEAKIKELLRRSNALDGTDPETHYQLGNLAMRENNYEEALRELQTSAKLDPEVAKVHLLLARVYRRIGREEEAAKETQLQRKLKEKEEQNADATAAIGTRHP
jgi:tetratricopeptide (TPR) repeat protein